MNSIKSVAVSAIIAFCSVSSFSKGSSHVEEVQTNQSVVYASDYRPMVCLPHYRIRTENECSRSDSKG